MSHLTIEAYSSQDVDVHNGNLHKNPEKSDSQRGTVVPVQEGGSTTLLDFPPEIIE
jgi:hypothetical protein